MNVKRLVLVIFLALTAACAAAGLSACSKNEEIVLDHNQGNWETQSGVYLGMVSDEECPAGNINESLVKNNIEMDLGEEYYFIIDFTLQPLEDNDGRGSVDVSVEITPAVAIDVTLQETSSGTFTENTFEDTKQITVPFSIPEKAEEARDKRIVLRFKPLIASEYDIEVTFNADKPLTGNLTNGSVTKTTSSQFTEGLEYAETDGAGHSVSVGTAQNKTEIVIPYYANGNYVTEIGRQAFYKCSSLTSVTIPDSVTSISSSAFYGCSGLTSITIPVSVKSIGALAFYSCSGLTDVRYSGNIAGWCKISFGNYSANPLNYGKNLYINNELVTELVIPDNVTSIGSYAFYDCSGLTSVTIGNRVTSIGEKAFSNCSGLTSVIIGNGIMNIGSAVFSGCSNIEYNEYNNAVYLGNEGNPYLVLVKAKATNIIECTINDKTKIIYDSAFYNCSGLTSIIIPDNVTSIGSSAFWNCYRLTELIIPNRVTSIGNYAFEGCSGLISFAVDENNSVYYSENNCLIEKDSKALILGCKNSVIPDGVTSIGKSAFEGCGELTSVTIPDSVTSIDDHSFYLCSGLTSVTIGNGVTNIGDSAFSGCSGLKNIVIPESVTNIGQGAFNGCSKLESITLPFVGDSVKSETDTYQYPFGYIFGTSSYAGGTATEQKYFGSSTSSRTSTTYYIPETLKIVTITGGNILLGAFSGCSEFTEITIPNSVTSIGDYAFENCSGLTELIIPESVTSIGNYAFSGCSGLTSVTIPDSVTNIGEYAFSGCSGLTEITIPDSVTSIGNCAFSYCHGLKSIVVDKNNSEYYSENNCIIEKDSKTMLLGCKNSVIPYGVTSIGEDAFWGCSGLTSIVIPDTVTSIGNSAFYGCKGLTNVTIPGSVTSIGWYAFTYCNGLTDINFEGTIEQWKAISKDSSWNLNTGNYTIHCTDGDILK